MVTSGPEGGREKNMDVEVEDWIVNELREGMPIWVPT